MVTAGFISSTLWASGRGRGGLVASFTGSGGLLEFDLEGSAAKGFRVRGFGV